MAVTREGWWEEGGVSFSLAVHISILYSFIFLGLSHLISLSLLWDRANKSYRVPTVSTWAANPTASSPSPRRVPLDARSTAAAWRIVWPASCGRILISGMISDAGIPLHR